MSKKKKRQPYKVQPLSEFISEQCGAERGAKSRFCHKVGMQRQNLKRLLDRGDLVIDGDHYRKSNLLDGIKKNES